MRPYRRRPSQPTRWRDEPRLQAKAAASLAQLGLEIAQAQLDPAAQQAEAGSWSYHFLGYLLDAEIATRHERTVAFNPKFATLPYLKRLADLDFKEQPASIAVSSRSWPLAASSTTVARWSSGPPGVGKAHLAIPLGVLVAQMGHRIYFTTAIELGRADVTVPARGVPSLAHGASSSLTLSSDGWYGAIVDKAAALDPARFAFETRSRSARDKQERALSAAQPQRQRSDRSPSMTDMGSERLSLRRASTMSLVRGVSQGRDFPPGLLLLRSSARKSEVGSVHWDNGRLSIVVAWKTSCHRERAK